MKNIAILCSGGDDMPIKGEKPHVLLDNIKLIKTIVDIGEN